MPSATKVLFLGLAGVITAACAKTQSTEVGAPLKGATHASANHAAAERRDSVKFSTSEGFRELQQLSVGLRTVQRLVGQASYYGDSLSGHKMASGERYLPERPCAAHRSLPFGTLVRVHRVSNGKEVVLRVMDRGPYGNKRRILDVSRSAAERLDMLRDGVADVRVEVLAPP